MVTGLDPGRWRIRGDASGSSVAGLKLRFRDPDGEVITVDVKDDATLKVEAVVLPAPFLSATLRCIEPIALPSITAVRLVSSAVVADGDDPFQKPVLARDGVSLVDGKLRVGPLDDGAYHVAVRPHEVDWWTWYPGREDALHADSVSIAGESLDLGTIEIACGPLIIVRPLVASGQALPDLRRTTIDLRELDGDGVEVKPSPGRTLDARAEEVRIRGIDEGEPLERIAPLDGEVSMSFLPSVIRAEYRGEHQIHVAFNDGVEGTIDFAPWLRGPIFEPLKELEYFRRFFLDGGTIAWPNGADVAPETLYDCAKPEAA